MLLPPLSLAEQKRARMVRLPKHRQTEGLFLVEGMTIVREAVAAGLQLEWIASSAAGRSRYPEIAKMNATQYDSKELQQLSALQTVPDVVALVHLPAVLPFATNAPIIYLDGIADPGNLGTIFRTGAWFGITQWILRDGGCDPYNPKVVRAAMGALFKSSVHMTDNPKADLLALKQQGYALLASIPSGGSKPVEQVKPYCLMVGQEARGLEASLQAISTTTLTIPSKGQMESLNAAVAFGILTYTVTVSNVVPSK